MALRRQTCGFDFDTGAQLHDLQRFAQRIQLVDFDTERPASMLRNKRSDPVPDNNETIGAKARHRFAHHRPADAGCVHHFLFCRKL